MPADAMCRCRRNFLDATETVWTEPDGSRHTREGCTPGAAPAAETPPPDDDLLLVAPPKETPANVHAKCRADLAEARAALAALRARVREVERRAALPITPNVNGLPSSPEECAAAIAKCARLVVDHVVEPLAGAVEARERALADALMEMTRWLEETHATWECGDGDKGMEQVLALARAALSGDQ